MKVKLITTNRAFEHFHILRILMFAFAWLILNQYFALGQRMMSRDQPEQSRSLHLRYSNKQSRPLSMVTGDFDEDGVGDLVIGYGLQKGGSIAFLRGNLDAHAPQTHESWLAAGQHQYADPYLQLSKPISVSAQPTLMLSADVNGDGHLDLVYATQGSTQINVMFGDGAGNFSTPVSTSVAGGITALAAYRPGAPLLGEAIVAGYQLHQGARLSILSYSSSAFTTSATYALPATATSMSVANLDADRIPDTAIVAGGQLVILHGKNALSGGGAMTTVPVSGVESVTTGQFLFDRHAQLQLSVLTSNGDVVTLAHQGFDPTPYAPQEIAAARHAQQGHSNNSPTLAQQAGNTGDAPWIEVETNSAAAVHPASGKPPIIVRSRSIGGFDDLVVLNTSQQQRTVISHSLASPRGFSGAATQLSTQVTSSGLSSSNVVAAVSASVSPDARNGLVVLNADSLSPNIIVPASGNTFYVNVFTDNTGTTTDPPTSTRCTLGQPTSNPCTLRDAITYVNSDATDNISAGKSDTIMLPAGTYSLTWQAGTFDANANALTHLEVLGPVTVMGVSGSTIINGNNNDTIFTINPGAFGSFNPSGASYVFNMTLENLTIENGKNNNNPVNSSTGLFNNVGGCINWDANSTGNLTITNSVIKNCTIEWGDGGGIWAENSAGGGTGTLTLSGDTIQNNSTSEIGGGLYVAFAPAAVVATNTVFSGNKADTSVNPGDPGADGEGGGMYFEGRTPPPATPQTTLTGVTISSNTAGQADGGGIATFTGLLLSGSLISSNSAGGYGGGIWSNAAGDGSQTTITSSNFLSNSATTSGGAIALGIEAPSTGNILQVSLSRIFGNTSTNGASGLANGISGQGAGQAIATNNWWGCNTGPTTASDGCDQAVLYNSAGSLTTSPFAQLGFTSNITTIPPAGSMDLTVSMGSGITGAFPAVATNYSYTYTVTGVTANPALTTGTFNTSGVGTATLTPVTPTTNTNGSVEVKFDNQTDTINFTAQALAATSLAITANPSSTYLYGQPSSLTVQFTPSNATGITTSDFAVTVDGSSSGLSLTLISNNNYQISGLFNALAPGSHTLKVSFLGTTNYASSSTTALLTVSAGTVTISDTVTPTNPVQGQGGTVKVTVAGVGSGAVPTGSITYRFNGGTGQSAALSGGVANITIPTIIPTGSNSLSLAYSGDTNYAVASTAVTVTIFGKSQTTIASLTATTAQINVFGFGSTAPSGQLAFNDVTTSSPVTGPVTLNTATATPSLLPQVTTSTGANSLPVWTELADLNGDGILDLITSVFGTDSVNVQLGIGDGTFGVATTTLIVSGFGPSEVHAVSLRGSGTLDLIIGSYNTNQIAVLLGNSNGTFQAPAFYTVGTATNTPTSLTTGDFNHDGSLDVAVANTGDNAVSILLGNGSGSLTPSGTPINVGQTPEAIRASDFNGDGYSDLAVANYHDGTVSVLVNNQNGTFSVSPITVGSGPQALAITGTGASQLLAVANFGSNNVSVLKNNGSGTFAAQTTVSVGNGPDDVRIIDINADSIPDFIVSNYTDGTVNVATGSAGGTYTVLGPFTIGTKPYSAAAGDLDGSGTGDVVVANTFSNNTGVLLSGTQISVPYTGLSLPAGNTLNATYSPDGNSKYGASTSPNVTAP
jgi:hypothetical protein